MLRPSSQNAWQSRVAKLSMELVVIILGVLVALAADRWNQTRIDRAVQDAYLARFVREIRADSVRAAEYVDTLPGIAAALDSLESFIAGGAEPPELVATTLAVSVELELPQPVTWAEIQASNSLAPRCFRWVNEGGAYHA